MCGICGVAGLEPAAEAELLVRRMMAAMRHRGPDDEGLLAAPLGAPPVTLGMRRLSIIDLPGGRQPVFNEQGDVAIVFNGEIYNFHELRQELEPQGHVFRTRSDTETIVHAYETWGEDCVQHLEGMFAFAILDTRKRADGVRLFLARDRLGIKPLYYAWRDGVLLFASEVRALLESERIPRQLSRQALEAYLLFGSVAEPMTLIEGVFSLPPGHRLTIPLARRGEPQPEPYWNPADAASIPAQKVGSGAREASSEVRRLLEDAVRKHLIADVPLGLFLSSGMDSTALVALASREKQDLHTFTVVFPEQDYSEAELARQTAERFSTRHQELLLSGEDMVARLDEAIAALDQPTMDGINSYFVSWAARQVGLKVALSGLGGDEVFGGYNTFRATPRAERLVALANLLPATVRSATASAAVKLPSGGRRADAARKLAAMWRKPDSLAHPYFFLRALFTPEQCTKLLRAGSRDGANQSPEAPWQTWLAQVVRQAERLDPFTRVSWLEMRSYMVNTLLRDTDAVSMSHSLEVRVPLLDHRLVECVARLPEAVKRRAQPKALLKDALKDLLTDEVARQRKRTFTFPWERWLRGELGRRVRAGLEDLTPALQPVLNGESVKAVWGQFSSGRTNWSRPWSLYVLNEWARRHLAAGASRLDRSGPAIAVAAREGSPKSGHSESSG